MALNGILAQPVSGAGGATPAEGGGAPPSTPTGLSGILGEPITRQQPISPVQPTQPVTPTSTSTKAPAVTPTFQPPAAQPFGLSLGAPDTSVEGSTPETNGAPVTFGDVVSGLKAIPGIAANVLTAIPKAVLDSEVHPSAVEQQAESQVTSHPTDTFGKVVDAIPNLAEKGVFRFFQPMFQPLADDINAAVSAPQFDQDVADGKMNYTSLESEFPALQKSNLQVVGDTVIAGLSVYMPDALGESVSKAAAMGGVDALKIGARNGAVAGGVFATAQVLASGTKDPKQIAKIYADNIVGATLLGGITHAAVPLSADAFTAATKDIKTQYGIPESVFIDPAKVKDVFQTGTLASAQEQDMIRSLGLSGTQYRTAIKEGLSIEIPAQNITTITDKPYWAAVKDAIGLKPTSKTVVADPTPQLSERILNPARQLPSPEDVKAKLDSGKTPTAVSYELQKDMPQKDAEDLIGQAQNLPKTEPQPSNEVPSTLPSTVDETALNKTPGDMRQDFASVENAHEENTTALQNKVDDFEKQVAKAPAQSAEKKDLKIQLSSAKKALIDAQSAHDTSIVNHATQLHSVLTNHLQTQHGISEEGAPALAGEVISHVTEPKKLEESANKPLHEIAANVANSHKTSKLAEIKHGDTVEVKSRPHGRVRATGKVMRSSEEGLHIQNEDKSTTLFKHSEFSFEKPTGKQEETKIDDNVAKDVQDKANKDWEENYADKAGERAATIHDLQKQLKEAKAADKPTVSAKLRKAIAEDAKIEKEFVEKWRGEVKKTPTEVKKSSNKATEKKSTKNLKTPKPASELSVGDKVLMGDKKGTISSLSENRESATVKVGSEKYTVSIETLKTIEGQSISKEIKKPETAEEAARIYYESKIEPAMRSGTAVIIGADDLKDYFGNDYDITRHPIYSKAANQLFERAIEEVKNPVVKFTIGGTGSGKSDFVVAHQAEGFDGVIYDSTGYKYEGGLKNQIEFAENHEKQVELYGVIPDLTRARAYTFIRELRGEHPVTEAAFIRTHAGAIDTMQKAIADGIPTYVMDSRGVVLDKEDFSKNPEFELNPVDKLAGLGYNEDNVKNAITGITKENASETISRSPENTTTKRVGKEGTKNVSKENRTGKNLEPIRTVGDKKLTVPKAKSAFGSERIFEGDTKDGQHFVTNAYILQFGDTPDGITATDEKEGAADTIENVVEGLKDSKRLSAPDRFSHNFSNATILHMELPNGQGIGVNSIYYNYFAGAFKGAELRGTDPKQAIGVYKDDKLVGLIMPIYTDGTKTEPIIPKASASGKDFSKLPEELQQAPESIEQDNSLLEKVPRAPKAKSATVAEAPKQGLDPRELYNAEKAIEQNRPRGYAQTVFKEVATWFNPRGQAQTSAVDVIMKNKGEYERILFRTEQATKEIKKMWDKVQQADALDFMDKVETGDTKNLPAEFKPLAEMYRTRLTNAYEAISEYKEVPFLENYFPHLWKDPAAVEKANIWAKSNARRPLSGNKSFLKHRIFATIKDGIEAGYQLETHNPEEIMQLHEQNIQKFLMANRIMDDLKARNFSKLVSSGGKTKIPDGFTKINDNIAKVYLNPHIPILEAYDQRVYDALSDTVGRLGLEHDRKYEIGQHGALGFTHDGSNKITTKFGTPLSVIAHELGHQLDYKYGLKNIFKSDPDRTYGSESDYTQKELRKLADLRYEGTAVTDSYKQYIRSASEKMAVMLEAYVHAPDAFKQVAPRTFEKFTAFLALHDETRPLLDVKPSLVMGTREDSIYAGGAVLGGEYYVQQDVARMLNNFLSPDHIMDTALGKGIMNVKNTMNAFELGFSAFHLTMETFDTMITKFGIGLTKVMHGNFTGFGDMLVSPTAPVTYFRSGQKFYNGDPELLQIEHDLFTGGASLREKQYYKNTMLDTFMQQNRAIIGMIRNKPFDTTAKTIPDSIIQAKDGQKRAPAIVKAVAAQLLRAPMAAVEATMRPLFTYYIPRLKVGAFRDLFASELQRNSQRIQDGEMTRASVARDVWNNIENRMGELNYDNLFWNRNLKTGLMLTTRAVGWNLGTVRELGGAAFQDVPRELLNTVKGKGFNFTPKMAYTLSLFFFVGMAGAIYQYLHTGKKPGSVKDLFYPQNGATTANGEPYRVDFPTYLKDIYQSGAPQLFTGHPFGAFDSFASMIGNKASPELSTILDIMQNKDFYGNEIRNPHDNNTTQAKQVALYLVSQLEPFTFQQQQNLAAGKSTAEQQAEAFLGIVKAPAAVISSNYDTELQALYTDQAGGFAPETPEMAAASAAKTQVEDQIKKGDYSGVAKLVQEGIIKPTGVRTFIENALMTTPQKEYKYLSPANKYKFQQEQQSQ